MTDRDQTHGVRQDSSQMSEEALVDGQESFGANGLEQAIKYTLVEIASLIVHPSHDSI